jgi:tetratricopeptide (TPR) repeat protein
MAEALLAEGDRDGAAREARLALELRRNLKKAISVLARARGEQEPAAPKVYGLIERARLLAERGNTARATELITKAIRFSNGPCPACHRELALVYEKAGRPEDAIVEWQAFAREDPDTAADERVAARIEALRQK